MKTYRFGVSFTVNKMLLNRVLLVLFLSFCFTKSEDLTFKEVAFKGYSVFTEKFKLTIPSGNRLKDFLPKSIYDDIEIKNQTIPVLYKDSLADLGNLDELVIEFCHVEEIRPGAISNVPMLRKLSFKGNDIKSIEFGVFNNLKISTLDLSSNKISSIHAKAFNDMPDLLNIQLADNFIQIWNPEWFKNTPLLTRISMQNNRIEEIPAYAFKNMKGIKKYGNLDLTINFVFSHNQIKNINPKAFSGLEKINNLWLDNNLLQEFHEDLLNGIAIDDLRLNNNNIKCFDGDLDKTLKANTNHIDSNPFDCDCLEQIKEWSKKKKNVEFSFAEMDCITQRFKIKMTALEKRLKELKGMTDNTDESKKEIEDVEIFEPKTASIK
ncbi:unnamed protein product [Psylliodes chrysocephalus]|uniref:Uncharacterized protein n=1 Tax=Psylliodes chrysocephalus TaxID=3402493 RepID=A0A9P0GH83_9CUCU|nr:unnamed protein product [Psylliodes chrysocephala]